MNYITIIILIRTFCRRRLGMEPNQFMAFMALRLQQQQVAAQQALDENQPLDFSTQRLNLSKYLPQRNLSLDSEGNSPRVSERQRDLF